MARQRFIWPTLWEDPDFGKLSHSARVLFVACFSNADDEGRLIGEPAHLRSIAFRYDEGLTSTDVRDLRDEIAGTCESFQVYDVDGDTFIAFTKWSDFQRPKYPKISKHPKPPKYVKPASVEGSDSSSVPEVLEEPSTIGLGRDGLDRTPLPPSNEGDQVLKLTPREAGTNPRAVQAAAKRDSALRDFVARSWDEYPDLEVLVDELVDRGLEAADAWVLIGEEQERRTGWRNLSRNRGPLDL